MDFRRDWEMATIQQKPDTSQAVILATQNQFKLLEEKHCQLKEESNTVSPLISSLPVEILGEIFFLVADKQPPQSACDYVLPGPLVLGSVCRKWRRIIWSISRLWNTVQICFSPLRIEMQNELLQQWFQRSGNSTLHIYLTCDGPPGSMYEPPTTTIDILLKTSRLWKVLHTPGFDAVRRVMESQENLLPSLSTLSITPASCSETYGNASDWNLCNVPCLTSLDISLKHTMGHLSVNWANLSHLKISLSPQICVEALRRCVNLKTCELNPQNDDQPDPSTSGSSTTLSSLTSLSFTGLPELVNIILNSLKFPNLKILKLNLRPSSNDDRAMIFWMEWTRDFIALLQLSGCSESLINFTMLGGYVCESHIIRMLDGFKNLSKVRLSPWFTITSELINGFNACTSKGFLPNLKELILDDISLDPCVDLESLTDMIRSRINPPSPDDKEPGVQKLCTLDIVYNNTTWMAKTRPDSLLAFFKDLSILSFGETAVNFTWNKIG